MGIGGGGEWRVESGALVTLETSRRATGASAASRRCRAGSAGAPLAFANSSRSTSIFCLAPVEQALERARLVARVRVRGQQRQRDRRIEIADHRVGQTIGIDLAPAHRLGRRRAGEAAGVRARIGDLQEVVVALLVDAEHFLDLRLGLQHEVLRAAAAADQHRRSCRRRAWRRARSTPSRSRRDSDRSRTCFPRARARRRSSRSTSRPATTCRSARRTRRRRESSDFCPMPSAFSRSRTYLPQRLWNSALDIGALELRALNDLPEERVGREQHVVVEEDVVDADDALFAQHDVRLLRDCRDASRGRARSACRDRDSRRSR